MPTPARISDLLDRHDHERLLAELVGHDTPLPLGTRLLLSGDAGDGEAVIGRALALSRLVEAGYRPSRRAIGLAACALEDARTTLDAPLWGDMPANEWVQRAALLGALSAWNERLALLTKLGVALDDTSPEHADTHTRLTDALASWCHAQLCEEGVPEVTTQRVTLVWLLSEHAPEALRAPLDRLITALDGAGAAHHPTLGSLFVVASRRRTRALEPAIGTAAA